MTRRNVNPMIRYLQQLAASGSGASDAELLERYVRHHDEAAFELLLWRHGTLVHNVCRRLLPCVQDAEDAFQATFLAFVRKAHAIVRQGSVASWLYKVAYRVALQARERARKQSLHEKLGGEQLALAPETDPLWAELRPILDEEVNRLPERLRRPFVLCYLEGKTNEEAARQLGCPAGTIFSRLARGRALLRQRLLRRGVTLSVAGLTAALAEHAAEATPAATLMTNTVRAALRFAVGHSLDGSSLQAAALAEGVLRSMFVTKIKMVALLVLIVGLFAAGGLFTRHALTAASQPEDARDKPIVSCVLPKPGGLQRMASFNGHVRAAAQQQVYPVVSGHVKRIAVDIGDRVKQGDVLAEIEAPLLAAEVKQATSALEMAQAQEQEATARIDTAEAEVEAAKVLLKVRIGDSEVATAEKTKWQSEVNRLTREVERNVIAPQVLKESQNQLALAKAKGKAGEAAVAAAESDIKIKQCKLSQARAARQAASAAAASAHAVLDKARIQESFTQLKATLDGVVMSRNINTGDFVSASDQGGRQPLMIVLRTDPMRVVVDVPESEIPFIRAGAAVHLRINALPEVKLPDCKVSRTGFAIDEKTGTMPVEIDVPNPKLVLRPGLFITASIHLDKKAPAGAVLVPASSVVKRKGRSCVYLVRDGEAHLTPIQVSWSSGDNVEIESGVRASDRLVVNPRGLEGEVVPVEVKKAP